MYSDTVNGLVDRPPLELPEAVGAIVHLQEKLFVPVKEYPDVSANNTRALCFILVISAFFFTPKHTITASAVTDLVMAQTFERWSPVRFRASRVSVLTRFLFLTLKALS